MSSMVKCVLYYKHQLRYIIKLTICDMIKGNESLVLRPLSYNFLYASF